MRLHLEVTTRRAALAALAATLATVNTRPARALVDGVPFYAPGDKFQVPAVGFEFWLPKIEELNTRTLPALRATVDKSDWRAAALYLSKDAVSVQLQTLGSTASIMGDEAYTALGIKAKYGKALARLQQTIVADTPSQPDALGIVSELEACVAELLGLIPQSVVDQVRKLEQAKASLAAPPPVESAAAPE